MVGVFSRLIFALVSAGISYRTACEMPLDEANAMLACYWQSNGIKIERMACNDHGIDLTFDRSERFAEISNRERSWPLEQL